MRTPCYTGGSNPLKQDRNFIFSFQKISFHKEDSGHYVTKELISLILSQVTLYYSIEERSVTNQSVFVV